MFFFLKKKKKIATGKNDIYQFFLSNTAIKNATISIIVCSISSKAIGPNKSLWIEYVPDLMLMLK
jgi:hypothetical protein